MAASRQDLPTKLAKARQQLQKVQRRVAELEAQLLEEPSIPSKLLDSHQQLSVIVEHAPAAIAMLDADMKYLLVSQRWLTDYHLKQSDVIGRSHYEIFPDAPERWREIHQRCLTGAVESNEADPLPRADGSIDWIRWEIHPWRNNHGDIGGIYIFSEVIPQRKLEEETLQTSELRFSSLVEAFEDYAIYLLDSNGHIASWNTGAERLKGYSSDEIIGQHFSRFFTPEDQQIEKPRHLLETAEAQGRVEAEGWRVCKDGSRFWANGVITALRNVDGSLKGFAKITRDLTERKRAEENIRKLHRTLSVLSDINQAIVRIRHLPSLFEKACQIAVEKGTFRMAWIGLFDPKSGNIDPVAHAGIAKNDLENLLDTLNTLPLTDSFRAGEKSVFNDIQNDPMWLPWREEASRLGYAATVALHLIVEGEIRGIFNLYADELDFFDIEELRLMDEMAGDISLAMEIVEQDEKRTQAEAAVKRYAHRMEILHRIDRGIINANSNEEIVETALKHIRQLIPCQRANVGLIDLVNGEGIIFAVDYDGDTALGKGLRISIRPDFFDGYDESHLKVVPDLRIFQDTNPRFKRAVSEGLLSGLNVLLMDRDKPIGTLGLFANTVDFFTAEHREIATEIASQLAIAIRQQSLQKALADYAKTQEEDRHFLETILDAFPANCAVLDPQGTIIRVNAPWKHFADENDARSGTYYVGTNYLSACEQNVDLMTDTDAAIATGIRAVIAGEQESFYIEYPCHSPTIERWFILRVTAFEEPAPRRVLVAHIDDTARKLAEDAERQQWILAEALRNSLEALTTLHDVEAVMQQILIQSASVIPSEAGSIILFEGNMGRVAYSRGFSLAAEEFFKHNHVPLDGGPFPTGYGDNDNYLVADTSAASHWVSYPVTKWIRSSMGVSIILHGKPIGLLIADSATPLRFQEKDIEIFRMFARYAALALENAHLVDQLEHKVAQRTADLQAALVRVEAILNNSPDAILLADSDLTIQQANSSFNTLFGSEWDTYFGKSLLTLFHPDDAHRSSDFLETAVNQQNGKRLEVRALRNDGTNFDSELSVGVMKGDGLVCIIRDITERNAQERQLRYHASLQESVSDAIIATDTEFRIRSWNKVAERIYGWTAEEVIGKTVRDVLHTQHQKGESRELAKKKLSDSHEWHSEVRQRHKNGNWLDISASVSQITDEKGGVIGAVSVNRDISDHKAYERQLRYHASIQESVSDAVIATDMDFRIQSWNRAAEVIYGWSALEAIGKLAQEVLKTSYESEVDGKRIRQDFLENGAWQGEVIQRHRDGSPINILASVNLFKDNRGQSVGVVSVNRDITERKRVAEALQKSSAEIHDLYNNAPCGYHSIDREGLIVQINDTELRWLGYAPDEVIGKLKIRDVLTPDSVLVFQRTFPVFIERGHLNDVELDMVRKDGSIMHILLNAAAIYDEDGQYLKSRSTIFDITELRQAQQTIIESEERYRLLAENIGDVIAKVSPDGIRTFITPSCFALLGYTPDELIGKPSIELVHPDDGPISRAMVIDAINTSKSEALVTQRVQHKARHYLWVEVKISILRDPTTGGFLEVIMVMRDITQRKEAEELLRASEGRYRLLAENIADMIMTFSLDRVITYMSPSCERLLGYLPEEVEGKLHSEFIHPEDYPQVIDKTRQAVVSKENLYTNQFRLRNKAGHYIWYEVRTRIVYDPNTSGVGQFISVLRDITERKRAEDALRESEDRFRRAIIDAPFPIMIHAEGGEILHISNTWAEISGYTHNDIPTMTDWVEKAYRENSQTVKPVIEKVYALTQARRGGEFKLWTKSGEERIWDFMSTPLALLPDGRRMVSSMAMDITERKHAEEALQIKMEEERQFQSHLKSLHEIIIVLTGIDELDVFCKRTVELGRERLGFERLAMFLYDEQDGNAVGTFGTDTQGNLVDERGVRFKPDPIGIMQRSFERAERFYLNEQTTLYNAEIPVGHGWNAAAVLWNGTRSLGWLVADNLLSRTPAAKSLLDIIGLYSLSVGTLLAQKQTQHALRESEALHRLLAENINDLIMRSSLTSKCLYVSPSVRTLLGYAPEELLGQETFDLVHPDDKATISDAYSSAFQRNEPIVSHQYRARHKDGHYVWLETVGKPLFSEEAKEISGVITSSRNITERKQAEQALRESEEKFRLLLDAAPVATVISDQKGRINLINVQAENLFGYRRSELTGQMVEVLVPDYARDKHRHHRTTYIAAPGVRPMGLDMELFARHKDGSDVPVEIQLSYIQTADGIMVMSFILDITERKRFAGELEQQRSFLRNVIDVSPSMIFVKDYDAHFVLANPLVAQMYNTTVEAIIGKTDADLNPSNQGVTKFLEADRHVITSGEPFFIEEPITNSIGKTHWLQTTKVPIVSADGKSKYVLGVSTDITERKEAEEALRVSEEKFRLFVESAPMATFISDKLGNIILLNHQAEKLFGYPRSELLGKSIDELVPEHLRKAHIDHHSQYLSGAIERRTHGIEAPALHRDGRIFPAEVQLSYVDLSDNPLVISSVIDVTARKQAEDTLRQALAKEKELGELKSRFVSMASHEFRTPLATINALTDTLKAYRHRLADNQIEERLSKIQGQIEHLKDIMDDVLLLARMQARRVDFTPATIDLDSLCRSVIDEFQSRPDITHQFNYSCDERLREVILDKKLMRQIINNLISNSVKYSPSNSSIMISLAWEDNTLIFVIKDQGIGIPETDVKHLFEPFHRAGNVGTASGTGLGLVITKEAIELHNGTISVESKIGLGTTFTVRIPLMK